jgi:hypothetical protein
MLCVSTGRSETLEEYAAKCDQAAGFTIPDFDCDAGTEVPISNYNGQTCDKPNRLNHKCDPGSRFQVLNRYGGSYAVAHCRKEGNAKGKYSDIAVIQVSSDGRTCFYQALQDGLDGKVKAPSKGRDAYPWKSPAETAAIKCGGCHDNGPIIRSPYLAQLSSGPNALPGAGQSNFNRSERYSFIGDDFAWWKVYKVEIENNRCNDCHRMGVSNIDVGRGTARDLGLRATAEGEPPSKNPHSPASPIWMPPGHVYYEEAYAKAAKAIADCANRFTETPLPSGSDCKITDYTGKSQPFERAPDNRHSGNYVANRPGYSDLVLVQGKKLVHYAFDDYLDMVWKQAEFYDAHPRRARGRWITPAAPISVTLIRSNFGTQDRPNLEAVVRMRPVQHVRSASSHDYLAHFYFDSKARRWNGPFSILADGQLIAGVTGNPALIQSNYGAMGDFQLVVSIGNTIIHYRRDNDAPSVPWRKVADVYTANAAAAGGIFAPPAIPSGLALIQSNVGDPNNLDMVARLVRKVGPLGDDTPGDLVHFYFDGGSRSWKGPFSIVADGVPATYITGDPAFLQSIFGSKGNFEVIVPQGNKVAHYYRDNDAAGTPWHQAGNVYDSSPGGVQGALLRLVPLPTGATMVQSDYSPYHLFAYVRMAPRVPRLGDPDYLAAFSFSIVEGKWFGPYPLNVEGQAVTVSGM